MVPSLFPRAKKALFLPLLLGALAAWGMSAIAAGCGSSEEKLPPRSFLPGPDGGGGFQGGTGGGPPELDAGGYCGNELHQAIIDAPNLYFVLDASGSMATKVAVGTRYTAVRLAILDLIRKLGPLVRVGAAILPGPGASADSCTAGEEVLATQQGDPITGKDGPTTLGFWQTTSTDPLGGTPISATLAALTPTLLALPGDTYVVLATDGGPNCNEAASCEADTCMLNIEGQCSDPQANCCASGNMLGGPTFCVDQPATVAALSTLATAGIHVIIVGIPGSETYAGVLDAMALAGGSQKPTAPFYEQVTDLDALGEVLAEIGKVAVSCEFELADPPTEQGMTNVYLDQEVLPYNDVDGWVWKPPATVRLLGAACDRLKSGQVKQVQIVSGCPTEMPK